MDIDVKRRKIIKYLRGQIQVLLQPGSGVAVIPVGLNRFLGQGIDGVRSDKRFDVLDIGVIRILGTGAGPQKALGPRPLLVSQFSKTLVSENLFEYLIGLLCAGDGHLAATLFCRTGFFPVFFKDLFQQRIDQDIDPAQEKTGHGSDPVDRFSLCGPVFQPADIGIGHFLISRQAEQKRDIDVDAVADEPADTA